MLAFVTLTLTLSTAVTLSASALGAEFAGPERVDQGRCGSAVTAVAEAFGTRWFATADDGVCLESNAGLEPLSVPFRQVYDLEIVREPGAGRTGGRRDEAIWAATAEGLFVRRQGTPFVRITSPGLDQVYALAADDDDLWAITRAVAFRTDPLSGHPLWAYWFPAHSRALIDVDTREGELSIATRDRGVLRRSPRSTGFVAIAIDAVAIVHRRSGPLFVTREGQVLTEHGIFAPLYGLQVLDLAKSDDTIWAACTSGVYRVRSNRRERLPGLPEGARSIAGILSDRLVVGTDTETFIYRRRTTHDAQKGGL